MTSQVYEADEKCVKPSMCLYSRSPPTRPASRPAPASPVQQQALILKCKNISVARVTPTPHQIMFPGNGISCRGLIYCKLFLEFCLVSDAGN